MIKNVGTQGNSKTRSGRKKRRSCGKSNYGVHCYHCEPLAPAVQPELGFRQKMALATTIEELTALWAETKSFKMSSPKTDKKWSRTFHRRVKELTSS